MLKSSNSMKLIVFGVILMIVISGTRETEGSSEETEAPHTIRFFGGLLLGNISGEWQKEAGAQAPPKLAARRMAVVIKSTPQDSWRRMMTRKSWLHHSPSEHHHVEQHNSSSKGHHLALMVPYFFFVEEPEDEEQQRQLQAENARHHDIIILKGLANRPTATGQRNLGLKTQACFSWVRLHFQAVDHLVMADDDVFVNSRLLAQLLPTFSRQLFVYGCVIVDQPVSHGEQEPGGHYSVFNLPIEAYPPYVSGPFRIFSWDVVVFFAEPALPPRLPTTEDAMLGLRLLGTNLTLTDSPYIYSWGVDTCTEADQILAVHLAYTETDLPLYEIANDLCASRILLGMPVCSWLPSTPQCQF